MTPRAASETSMSRAQWIILGLLVFSIFINYIDRANLSVAAPLLSRELNLGPRDLGLLIATFSMTYAGFQLFGIAGWLVDRFNVTLVFGAGFLLWSAATGVTGMVSGFSALVTCRLLLGMGESIAYPSYSKILAGYFPEYHRGVANALIDAGSKCGPALGTLIGALLMNRYGWRAFFIVLGFASLLWLVPWMIFRPRGRGRGASHPSETATLGQILRERSAWGTFAGLYCANYFWYFLLTWLPSYLVMERKFSMEKMAILGSIPYVVIAIATVISGIISDRWIGAGGSPTLVRKTFTVTGLLFSTILLPVSIVKDENAAIGLLFIACAAFGMFTSNHWAITQTIAGPAAAGKWTSFQNGVGNLAGVTAPWFTGWVVQQTGSFFLAFLAAAVIALTGAATFLWWIGPVEEVDWTKGKSYVATRLHAN